MSTSDREYAIAEMEQAKSEGFFLVGIVVQFEEQVNPTFVFTAEQVLEQVKAGGTPIGLVGLAKEPTPFVAVGKGETARGFALVPCARPFRLADGRLANVKGPSRAYWQFVVDYAGKHVPELLKQSGLKQLSLDGERDGLKSFSK